MIATDSKSVRRSAQSALRVHVFVVKVTARRTAPTRGRQSANSFHLDWCRPCRLDEEDDREVDDVVDKEEQVDEEEEERRRNEA